MEYTVRKAVPGDFPRIQEIYAQARAFMASTGNPNQWKNSHPPVKQLEQDIREGNLYVIAEKARIHGVFFFWIGADPTYGVIEHGSWRGDMPYGTIHRIAGDGSGGILRTAVDFCRRKINHLRIDTHEDNLVMQGALAKLGFSRRGIIYLEDGSARIAYDFLA